MVPIDEHRLTALIGGSRTCLSAVLDEVNGWITVAGELEEETAPVFAEVITGQVAHGRLDVRLDLSGVTFFDLCGVDALCAAQRDLEERGGALRVVRARDLLRTVCEILGHTSLLEPLPAPDPAPAPGVTGSRSG